MIKKREEENEEVDNNPKVLVFCQGRTIYFFDEVKDDSALECIRWIDFLEAKNNKKPISIMINSVGGQCYDGLAIYERMRVCKCPITTIGLGFIASMAFIIFLGGDERICTPLARFLDHQTYAEAKGNPKNIDIENKEVTLLQDACVDIISERTLQTPQLIKKETKLGDHYIYAQEAVNRGIVHKISEYENKEEK